MNAAIIMPIAAYRILERLILAGKFRMKTTATTYGTLKYQLVSSLKCSNAGLMT